MLRRSTNRPPEPRAAVRSARFAAQPTDSRNRARWRCRVIRGVILDKNARVGDSVSIQNHRGLVDDDSMREHGIVTRDGVTVVMRNAVVPSGTVY